MVFLFAVFIWDKIILSNAEVRKNQFMLALPHWADLAMGAAMQLTNKQV